MQKHFELLKLTFQLFFIQKEVFWNRFFSMLYGLRIIFQRLSEICIMVSFETNKTKSTLKYIQFS